MLHSFTTFDGPLWREYEYPNWHNYFDTTRMLLLLVAHVGEFDTGEAFVSGFKSSHPLSKAIEVVVSLGSSGSRFVDHNSANIRQ